ncbi:MAG: hypothetical protein OQK75_06230 [Gammaproteobacteria bacterium]|nr:hypothetical protein [Gammaproteobacteria bacterium]MCW8987253.1 hypothetical protein [Gammaproteobacteria bacterium]MCW9030327.1 hypothetical protein [Gammaproteobacteria bacterium]
MKRLHLIILTITLLLSQWGMIDHVYHDHIASDVCEYCVSAKSFDHAATSSVQSTAIIKQFQNPDVLAQASTAKTVSRYYAVRAPPRSI